VTRRTARASKASRCIWEDLAGGYWVGSELRGHKATAEGAVRLRGAVASRLAEIGEDAAMFRDWGARADEEDLV